MIIEAILRLPERGEHTFIEIDHKDLKTDQVVYELAIQTENMIESWAYGPFIVIDPSKAIYKNELYNPNTDKYFIGRPPFGVLTDED